MRRIAVFAVLLTVSILVGIGIVGIADANPFTFYSPIEPIQGTIPPVITICSPINDSIYPASIDVAFNVSKPELEDAYLTNVVSVTYALDQNESIEVYSNYIQGHGTEGTPAFNTTFTLPPLQEGNHKLTVTATGVVLKALVPKPQGFGDIGVFYVKSNSTILFMAGTPSIPPQTSANILQPILLIAILWIVTVAIVAAVSLVFFKRRKSKTAKVQKH